MFGVLQVQDPSEQRNFCSGGQVVRCAHAVRTELLVSLRAISTKAAAVEANRSRESGEQPHQIAAMTTHSSSGRSRGTEKLPRTEGRMERRNWSISIGASLNLGDTKLCGPLRDPN